MKLRRRTGFALGAALTLASAAACGRMPVVAPAGLAPAVTSLAAKTPVRAVPAGYYDRAESLTGDSLLAALKTIVSSHTDLGYDHGRDVLFASIDDLTDQDKVVSVYTGQTITGVTDRNTASKKGFNTEHTWPQSLGAEGVAKADLHHLFSADMKSNGIRSNYPFGMVTSPVTVLPDVSAPGQSCKLGTNAGGAQVFEPPDRHKGNVARALMYFYMCYGGPRGGKPFSLGNFTVERQVLLAWNKLDPVDDAERARNERIFAVQGNRNPFVDRPEFAERAGVYGASAPLTVPTSPAVVLQAPASETLPLANLAITDAVVTCSEIVHDERPVGFHLSGHLPTGEQITLFYIGREAVAPGTADVDVPDDAMIGKLKPLRGQYEIQVMTGNRPSEGRAVTAVERKALLAAVQRTLRSDPVGRNPLGQSVKTVLAFVERTLKDPKSSQE